MKRTFLILSVLCYCLSSVAQTIDIKFNGSTAEVTIPSAIDDVNSYVNGANVTLSTSTTSEYTYHVSGTTTDGSLTISSTNVKLTLQLDGVNIKSSYGGALTVACGKTVTVQVVEGTENNIEDADIGSQKAAMYFSGHPEFEGYGTLNVKGNFAHAISAKEYIKFKKGFDGTLNILGAVKDGIHCGKGKISIYDENNENFEKEFFYCNSGTINISNVGSDCIDAGDYGCMKITGGSLNLDVTAGDACGLKAVNTFIMTGGTINMNISGQDSDGIYINNSAQLDGGEIYAYISGNGSKGIKGKLKTTAYATGGNVNISGTKIEIIANAGDVTKADNPDDPSHCVGISIDGNLTNTGSDNVHVTSVGDEARAVTCDGTLTGTINTETRHWYVYPYDYKNRMTIYAVVDGFSTSDYDKYEVAAFIGGECRGTLEFGSNYGDLLVYSNSETTEQITFRIYNKVTKQTIYCNEAIGFDTDGKQGSPSDPFLITFEMPALIGDVNGDGNVNIQDLCIVIDYLNGKSYSSEFKVDVDGDTDVDLDDLNTLENIILEQSK